jgi:hemolysin III
VLAALARLASGHAIVVLVLGGLLYSAGALIFAMRWPDPAPRVFGYHEVFHAFTLAAAACHAAAIASVVLHT